MTERASPASATVESLTAGIVAVLFASDDPLEVRDLARILEAPNRQIEQALAQLLSQPPPGLIVQRHGEVVQLATAPEWSAAIDRLQTGPPVRISRAALEVLAIVAYRQPTTRAEIDQLRGVNSDRAVASLLARGLIEEQGRRETVGRPILLGTTLAFLELIGSASIQELPDLQDLADGSYPRLPVGEAGESASGGRTG